MNQFKILEATLCCFLFAFSICSFGQFKKSDFDFQIFGGIHAYDYLGGEEVLQNFLTTREYYTGDLTTPYSISFEVSNKKLRSSFQFEGYTNTIATSSYFSQDSLFSLKDFYAASIVYQKSHYALKYYFWIKHFGLGLSYNGINYKSKYNAASNDSNAYRNHIYRGLGIHFRMKYDNFNIELSKDLFYEIVNKTIPFYTRTSEIVPITKYWTLRAYYPFLEAQYVSNTIDATKGNHGFFTSLSLGANSNIDDQRRQIYLNDFDYNASFGFDYVYKPFGLSAYFEREVSYEFSDFDGLVITQYSQFNYLGLKKALSIKDFSFSVGLAHAWIAEKGKEFYAARLNLVPSSNVYDRYPNRAIAIHIEVPFTKNFAFFMRNNFYYVSDPANYNGWSISRLKLGIKTNLVLFE